MTRNSRTPFGSFPELFLHLISKGVNYILIGEARGQHGGKIALQSLLCRTPMSKLLLLTESLFCIEGGWLSTYDKPYTSHSLQTKGLRRDDAEYNFYQNLIRRGTKVYGGEDNNSNPFKNAKKQE